MIETTPYKGVIVTRLTRRYVEELYSVRRALETLAVERVVDRLQPENLDYLNKIIDEMGAAAQAGDPDRLVMLDLHFHEYILEVADHELVLRLWRLLEVGVQRCLHLRHNALMYLMG